MTGSDVGCTARDEHENRQTSGRSAAPRAEAAHAMSKSMHDGIAVWCDCCSCEAEPYWVAVAEEMGIDLGSDYEDPTRKSIQDS